MNSIESSPQMLPLPASGPPSECDSNPKSSSGAPSEANSRAEQKYQYQIDESGDSDSKSPAPVSLEVTPGLPLKSKPKHKKELNATNASENWRMILMARNQFTKHGRYGKPKLRKIVVNCNSGDVSWNGESKGLNVKNFVGCTFGKDAKPLQRDTSDADARLCFTLHFVSRDVCLQASTVHQAESFVEALTACAEYLKTNKRGSSKYRPNMRASALDLSAPAGAGGASSTGTMSRRGKAVMETLPDRAVSKHMRKVRRANTEKVMKS